MKAPPTVSPERMQQLRDRGQAVREQGEADRSGAVVEFRDMMKEWQRVVAAHSRQIDEYIAIHGAMTRAEVIDRALTKLLSES